MSAALSMKAPNKKLLSRQARLLGVLATTVWLIGAVLELIGSGGDLLMAAVIAASLLTVLFATLLLVLRSQRPTQRATLVTTLAVLAVGANIPFIAQSSVPWFPIVAVTCAVATAAATASIDKKVPKEVGHG
ncbi:hypothetical protein [Glutamicibacter uratoxydans]|uniref:hypothetical protein n=1 Tax=Glutamicibacter uratoxydans TaxID=43667 RepID=UPI003D6F4E1C